MSSAIRISGTDNTARGASKPTQGPAMPGASAGRHVGGRPPVVHVLPITRTPPSNPDDAIEMPAAVKRLRLTVSGRIGLSVPTSRQSI